MNIDKLIFPLCGETLNTFLPGFSDYQILCSVVSKVNEVIDYANNITLKYSNPLAWDITKQYTQNTVVVDDKTGVAYLSVQPVPVGVQITDEEYWTSIFNLQNFTDALKTAITKDIPQQENGAAATQEIPADSVFFVGDVLCTNEQAITDGTLVIIGSNCNQVSLVELLNSLENLLNEEQKAREQADNALQLALDDEQKAREEADEQLQNSVSYLGYYANIIEFGAKTDGSDCTAALASAAETGNTVFVPNGTYTVNGTVTLDEVVFAPDATILAGSASSITIKLPLAGRHRIFSGTLSAIKLQCSTVFPEWFGAAHDGKDSAPAFNAALAAMPAESTLDMFSYPDGYTWLTPVYLTKSRIRIRGYDCTLNLKNSGKLDATPDEYTEEVEVSGLKIWCTNTAVAIDVNNMTRMSLKDIIIIDPTIGFRANNSVNVELYNVTIIDQKEAIDAAFDLGTVNASIRLTECNSALGTAGTSYRIAGGDIRDIMLDKCESAGGAIGVDFTAYSSGESSAWDVWIKNCLFDNFKQRGLRYNYHKTACSINIEGCWFTGGAADAISCELNSAINMIISGCQFGGVQPNTKDILLNAPQNVQILGCSFLNSVAPIVASSGKSCNIADNVVTVTPDAPNYNASRNNAVEINNMEATVVINTTVYNPDTSAPKKFTNGVYVSSGCTRCQCVFTYAPAATTEVTNAASSGCNVIAR